MRLRRSFQVIYAFLWYKRKDDVKDHQKKSSLESQVEDFDTDSGSCDKSMIKSLKTYADSHCNMNLKHTFPSSTSLQRRVRNQLRSAPYFTPRTPRTEHTLNKRQHRSGRVLNSKQVHGPRIFSLYSPRHTFHLSKNRRLIAPSRVISASVWFIWKSPGAKQLQTPWHPTAFQQKSASPRFEN